MEISSSKKYNEPAAVAVVTILVNDPLASCRFDNNFMLDIIIFCSYIVSHRKVVVYTIIRVSSLLIVIVFNTENWLFGVSQNKHNQINH